MGTILSAAWRYRNKPSLLQGHFQNSKEFWCKFRWRGEIDIMTKEWYPSFPSHFGISWISFWKFVRQKQTRISGVSFCLGDNLVKYCSAIIVFQQKFCFFVLLFPPPHPTPPKEGPSHAKVALKHDEPCNLQEWLTSNFSLKYHPWSREQRKWSPAEEILDC